MTKEITAADLGKRTLQIAEYYFSNPTKPRKQMALDLGVHESRISQVLNHPKVRAYYRVLARGKVQDLVPKAVKAYEELIEKSRNDAVREKAASKIMANEKVLDGPTLELRGEIRISSVRELQQKVQEAALLASQNAIEAEIVDDSAPDTTQDTIHPDTTPQ